jgi:endonuclease YncB( thermonuclease family)
MFRHVEVKNSPPVVGKHDEINMLPFSGPTGQPPDAVRFSKVGRSIIMGRWLAIGGIVFLVALTVGLSQADVTEGRVVRIVDGDTIVVEGQGIRQKVRLSVIDAPERDQPWGNTASPILRA